MFAKSVVILAVTVLLSVNTNGATQTLDEAISAALDTHPSIDRAKQELRAAREQVPQAKAQFRSRMTFQSSISATDRDARLTDGQDFSDSAQPYSASINLTKPLYTGGLRPVSIRRARLIERAQRFRVQDEELQLSLDVIGAYYDVIVSQERLKVQTEVNKLIFAQIEAAEERFRLDVGTITDVSQVKSRYANSTASLTTAQTDLIRARTILESLTSLVLSDLQPPVDIMRPAATLDEAIAHAKNRAPALKAARTQYEASRMDVLAAARRNRPQVSLSVQATTARESSPAIERDDDVRATLSLSVPLTDGGAARSQRRQALATRNSLAYGLREQELQLQLYVTDAWLRYEAAEAEIIAQKERVTASEQALEGVIQGQAAGLWTTTDVLDATEQLALARLALVEAEGRLASVAGELRVVCGTTIKLFE